MAVHGSNSGRPATSSSNSKLTDTPQMCTVQLNSDKYFHNIKEHILLDKWKNPVNVTSSVCISSTFCNIFKGSESKVLWNTIFRLVYIYILRNDVYSIKSLIFSAISRRINWKVLHYKSKFIMQTNQLSIITCNNT